MLRSKTKKRTSLVASVAVVKSLHKVHRFLDAFPQKEIKQNCGELLSAALGSAEADSWSGIERSNMLHFFMQLQRLGKTLTVIDEELKQQLGAK